MFFKGFVVRFRCCYSHYIEIKKSLPKGCIKIVSEVFLIDGADRVGVDCTRSTVLGLIFTAFAGGKDPSRDRFHVQ